MPNATKYETYKNSGSEWLGDIPASWPMVLLSQIVTQVKNKNSDLAEKNLLSLSYGRIKRKPIDTSGGLLPASFDGYNIIEANDIILRLTDLQNDHTSLRVGLSTERGIITSAYTTMRPKNTNGAKYLYYLLHTFDIRKGFYGMGTGVRQGLNYDEVKRLKLPLPTETEQIAIADFLDTKVAHIDSVISEVKASIEEYKAWKASIIYEAVTKGLDPNVEMKHSGIEKFSLIPAKWKTSRFKYLLNIKSGDAISVENINDEDVYPVYGGGERIGYTGSFNATAGSILVGRVGARCGFTTLLTTSAWATDNALILEPLIGCKYLYYLLVAANLNSLNTSNAQPLITGTKIKNCFCAFTENVQEQGAIVRYLDKKCLAIDKLLSEKEKLIHDMGAYKKSLIYEVVTGKRKVV